MSYTMMKSVLLLWTPSLNDRSKLKGQCTDVEVEVDAVRK